MRLSNISVVVFDFLVQKIHQESTQIVLEGFNSRVGCIKSRLTPSQRGFRIGNPRSTSILVHRDKCLFQFAARPMEVVARLFQSWKQFVALVLKLLNVATDSIENLMAGIINLGSARGSEAVDVKVSVGIGRVLASHFLVTRMDHVAGNRGHSARRRHGGFRQRLEQFHHKRRQLFEKPVHFMILAQGPQRLLRCSVVFG